MEKNGKSGEQSGVIVKNRNSSGCLIVRKKSKDASAAGSSGARKGSHPKKEKKRPRMVMSDSGSSDELLMPPRRRVGPETIRVCNGLSGLETGVEDEYEYGGRKRDMLECVRHNEDGLIDGNEDRKRNRLDVFDFDEYDGGDADLMMDQGQLADSGVDFARRRFLGSANYGRGGIEKEFESSSSRHVEKRKKSYFERTGSFNQGGLNRFGMDRESGRTPVSLMREKYMEDSDEPIRLQGKNGVLKVMVKKKKKVGDPVNKYDHVDVGENRSTPRVEANLKRKISIRQSPVLETEAPVKPGSSGRAQKSRGNLHKSPSAKISKDEDSSSDDSDTALKLGPKSMVDSKSVKEVSSEGEKTPGGSHTMSKIKEGKVKRGSGTEKQKLRERIRSMLVDAGWKIDYRPRKNRDYLDAVYINPSGTAYWSIIKAYDALMKQLNEDEDEAKASGDDSPFTPLPDEVLSQLTRKTRKKMEKEMKRKQRDSGHIANVREAAARRSSSAKHAKKSVDSHEEKLSSFLKQSAKSSKNRMNENDVFTQNLGDQSSLHVHDERPTSSALHGRKSRKLGRCTLLVRGSHDGSSSESDGFVPYSGKRTLLSWLVDCGAVQLSQKVQYMNRRRTKTMLEGWITREGVHCGCCSKILTVSKFEIHAGSKLRQPFQNIYLDSGVSLLQCQIDAWNKLEESEHIGFHAVDVDGDDPNDDTCGICGDGGDLICCDGCPSTYHQNCLGIQMLPPGDWRCPNCTCKFCGKADEDIDNTAASELPTCNLCERKYHISCMQEIDALPDDSNSSVSSFCGQKCRELFEQLQKYLGVKHELESGFTWSLIRRTDDDSDSSLRSLPQRVECNSKLAVALTVMDECFLPIVDRRSGINLIHNVLYNTGSNFNRLNYSGFYTAILERGDELISAASVRFHGTQLAEMPFIGTRHTYRRQGMCRRLFSSLESALCSLKVEKLVIPAIAQLINTWTGAFGFTNLEDSLKQEIRSLNMLVFPGIDMLQKLLLKQESIKEITPATTDSKQRKLKGKLSNSPEPENMDSSAEADANGCADGSSDQLHADDMNGEIGSHSGSFNASVDVSGDGAACTDSSLGDKLPTLASEGTFVSDSKSGGCELENKSVQGSDVTDICQSSEKDDKDVIYAVEVNLIGTHKLDTLGSGKEARVPDSDLGSKITEFDADRKPFFVADMSQDAIEQGIKPARIPVSSEEDVMVMEEDTKPASALPFEDDDQSTKECNMDYAPLVDAKVAAPQEVDVEFTMEEKNCPEFQSDNKAESAHHKNGSLVMSSNEDEDKEMGNKTVSDSVEANTSSLKEDVEDSHPRLVNTAASHEDEIPISADETALSALNSGDEFVVCQNGTEVHPVSTTAYEREHDTDDTCARDDNIVASNELETPVCVEGDTVAHLPSKDNGSAETASEEPLIPQASDNNLLIEDEPPADSTVKLAAYPEPAVSSGQIMAENNVEDRPPAYSTVEIAEHPDSVPSSGQIFAENSVEDKTFVDSIVDNAAHHEPDLSSGQIIPEDKPPVDSTDENAVHPEHALSSGKFNAANATETFNENPASSSQTTVDANNQITCEKEHIMSDTSEAKHCEESCAHPGSDSSMQSNTVEGKIGSILFEPKHLPAGWF